MALSGCTMLKFRSLNNVIYYSWNKLAKEILVNYFCYLGRLVFLLFEIGR